MERKITYAEAKQVMDSYHNEAKEWLKNNDLTELPEYNKLVDKQTLGKHYRLDQIYFERLTTYKSTYFGLISFFNNLDMTAGREEKRNIENAIVFLNNKVKELDSKIEAGRNRLQFYKTIVYMVGNVVYGVE